MGETLKLSRSQKSWRALALFIGLFAAAAGVSYSALGFLVDARPRVIGAAPHDLDVEAIELRDAQGRKVGAWFVDAGPGSDSVLLMHGKDGCRLANVARARFLGDAGYSCLLIDLQAHGESEGEFISFGVHEAASAHAAVLYLRSIRPERRVVAFGTSLGAAACLLGDDIVDADVFVLESLYPTIEEALDNRLRKKLGPFAVIAAPLLMMQMGPRFDLSASQLRPIERLPLVDVPVFVISGAEDTRTTAAETERLFAAANSPKELWLVPGVGHQDLHRHAGAEYEQRLLAFLAEHLAD